MYPTPPTAHRADALQTAAPDPRDGSTPVADRQQVRASQLQMAYERLRPSVLMSIGVSLIFIGPLFAFFLPQGLYHWIAVILSVSAARYALWWVWSRSGQAAGRAPAWEAWFVAGATAAGGAWGVGPSILSVPAGDARSMLLVGAVLAVSAVAAVTLAASLRALLGFLLAALLPTAWALYRTGGLVEACGSLVVLAGLASLVMVGRGSNRIIATSIESQQQLAQAVRQIDAARERALAASHAKTRFLANMSHELRSPLNAVIGAAQLLKAGGHGPADQAQLVDGIHASGSNLLGLIENIMDLSRIEAGEMRLVTERFDLCDLVEAVLATATLAAQAKHLALACIVDPGIAASRTGDALRVRQVLLNLLGNAVKFTSQGEVVLRVRAGGDADELRLEVSDSGVGIPAHALGQVFEPFRQADERAARRFGGSGLGLAIVRQLIDAMGGRIGVHSEPGRGTRFEIDLRLPVADHDPPAGPGQPIRSAGGTDLPGELAQVVLYEPHPASAEGVQATLARLGCTGLRLDSLDALCAWSAREGQGAEPARLLLALDHSGAEAALDAVQRQVGQGRVIGMGGATPAVTRWLASRPLALPALAKPVLRQALRQHLLPAVGATPSSDEPPTASATAARATVPMPDAGHRPRVLVVEDDALNRRIVCRLLQHEGCEVVPAADGAAALGAIARSGFDLVLMDWQMPDMDGLEVTRRLRAGEAGDRGRVVPIVALTANAFAEDRDACLAAGMNDFLTKPVQHGLLAAAVRRWAFGQATGEPTEAVPIVR